MRGEGLKETDQAQRAIKVIYFDHRQHQPDTHLKDGHSAQFMTFTVKLSPSGHTFSCEEGQEILKAGLAAGHFLPFSCRSGMCLTCRGSILSGQVDHGDAHTKYLSEHDREQGLTLLCCARPQSDLLIEIEEMDPHHGNQAKKMPSRVLDIKTPAPDVKIITLGLPANEPIHFRAGQFLDVLLKTGEKRSYSIASPPKAEGVRQLELHIRHLPGGLFTDHAFSDLKLRDILQIEVPLGNFYLRQEHTKPIIMVASGTGFAPIKSIILDVIHKQLDRPIHLYWGARKRIDLYDEVGAKQMVKDHLNLDFIPVLSEPTPDCQWTGRVGNVHEIVMQDHPNMQGFEVYACGAPVMVEKAKFDFVESCHLKPKDFYADAFISMADQIK